jgi:hypothetical protein
MIKKVSTVLAILSFSTAVTLSANQNMMPPSFGANSDKPYPESCNALPKMIVFLPPPMEIDFIQCKNDLNMPTIAEASKSLVKRFGKGISGVKIELAEGFHQLYKVNFSQSGENKTIFVNGSLTKFIDGSLLDLKVERKIEMPPALPQEIAIKTSIEVNKSK